MFTSNDDMNFICKYIYTFKYSIDITLLQVKYTCLSKYTAYAVGILSRPKRPFRNPLTDVDKINLFMSGFQT